jgi:hypothetical protein
MWILVLVGTQSFPAPEQQRIFRAVEAITFSDTSDSRYLAAEGTWSLSGTRPAPRPCADPTGGRLRPDDVVGGDLAGQPR